MFLFLFCWKADMLTVAICRVSPSLFTSKVSKLKSSSKFPNLPVSLQPSKQPVQCIQVRLTYLSLISSIPILSWGAPLCGGDHAVSVISLTFFLPVFCTRLLSTLVSLNLSLSPAHVSLLKRYSTSSNYYSASEMQMLVF